MTFKSQYNRKTVLETEYLSRHLEAAIPQRSAQTDVRNTLAQRQERIKKSLGDLSYSARADRDRFHAKATTVARTSQHFLRNGTSVYPKKRILCKA